MTVRKITIISLSMVLAVFLLSACNLTTMDVGPLQTEEQIVELGDAERVSASIDMGIGRLEVAGGASDLLEATFKYNLTDWRPQVTYAVEGSTGDLRVQQPESNPEAFGIPESNVEYSWDLRLNESVPLDLNIKLGVGQADLELGDLYLSNVNINTGVGETSIDLSGKWREDATINVEGGVGAVELVLPDDVGVVVQTQAGLGGIEAAGLRQEGDSYTNDAYGESEVTLTVNVQKGLGEIRLIAGE